MNVLRACWILLGSLTAALPAQTTHKVTGPNLQTAIKSAKAGDILLVTGYVSKDVVVDKPLFIYGTKGYILWGVKVVIRSIPKGASVTFSGFGWIDARIQNCAGYVLLSRFAGGTVVATDCADLAITECVMGNPSLLRSRVAVSQCTFRGNPFSTRFPHSPGTHGLNVVDSSVTMWDSTITGGRVVINNVAKDLGAIALNRSTLWVHRSTLKTLGVGMTSAITGSGSVLYDPSVVFSVEKGATPIQSTLKATRRSLPLFTMPQTPLGARAVATLHALSGSTYGMFVGLPGAPIAIPGIVGVLEVAQPILLNVGQMPASGFKALPFTVPSAITLRGVMFRWQGITVRGATAEWSNAVMESHH